MVPELAEFFRAMIFVVMVAGVCMGVKSLARRILRERRRRHS